VNVGFGLFSVGVDLVFCEWLGHIHSDFGQRKAR
jgi:hypothetical protein